MVTPSTTQNFVGMDTSWKRTYYMIAVSLRR